MFVITMSADGLTLYSGSQDSTIGVWDVATGTKVRSWSAHQSGVICFDLSADGKTLVSGGYDKTIRLWDVASGRQRLTFGALGGGHYGAANAVAFSADGAYLASAGSDGTVIVRDARTGVIARILQGPIWLALDSGDLPERAAQVSDLAFDPTGPRLTATSLDAFARTWELITGKPENAWHSDGTGPLYSVAAAPDGRTVALGGSDGNVWLHHPAVHRSPIVLSGHKHPIVGLAFSRAGDVLVSASGDRTARIWNMAKPPNHLTLSGHERGVVAVAVSPDGKTVATTSFDKTLRLWDAATGKERTTDRQRLPRPGPVAFSPNGKLLAVAADDEVRVRNLETGKEEALLEPDADRVTGLAFSPDGKAIATATATGFVMRFDIAGEKRPPAAGVSDPVLAGWWHDLAADDASSTEPFGAWSASPGRGR